MRWAAQTVVTTVATVVATTGPPWVVAMAVLKVVRSAGRTVAARAVLSAVRWAAATDFYSAVSLADLSVAEKVAWTVTRSGICWVALRVVRLENCVAAAWVGRMVCYSAGRWVPEIRRRWGTQFQR
jgi:hypothetical protein